MKKSFIFDAKNIKEKKLIRKSSFVEIFGIFIVLMFFPLATTLILFSFIHNMENSLEIALSWFGHSTLFIVLFLLVYSIPVYFSRGANTVKIDLLDDCLSIKSSGSLGGFTCSIKYSDITKVYIAKHSKTALWQRWLGFYLVCYDNKKELRNGIIYKGKTKYIKTFPPIYSLTEATEIVAFIEKKRMEQ